MKNLLIANVIFLCVICIYNVLAQEPENIYIRNTKFIVCPASQESHPAHIPPPKEFLERYNNPDLKIENKSTFNVEYIGFTTEAKAAFQYAVDIWQSILISPVEINVRAEYTELDPGILGYAAPGGFARLLRSSTVSKNYFYPIAIVEKIRKYNLNGNNPDIVCSFSSALDWYLGTDGNVPFDKYDFVTTVLHELGHGLGFLTNSEYYHMNTGRGTLRDRFSYPRNDFSGKYETLLVNGTGSMLFDESLFSDPSLKLGQQLTGEDLFFSSPIVRKINSGNNAKLYAPGLYNPGSSISHLDEDFYPSSDINTLMTPKGGRAEASHDPGPIMLAMFAELGWVHLYIEHQNLPFIEDPRTTQTITARITADSVIDKNSIFVYYSNDKFASDIRQAKMLSTPNADEYKVDIPAPGGSRGDTIAYYISAEDNLPRTYTLPGDAPQIFYKTSEGQDRVAPNISLQIFPYILLPNLKKAGIPIVASVTDNFAVEKVYVEFSINNVEQANFPLNHLRSSLYGAFLPSNQALTLEDGDVIKYRIVAQDISKRENKAFEPSSGRHEFVIRDFVSPAKVSYLNNFNRETEDFVSNGFRTTTPDNFNNKAIHSEHPYSHSSNSTFLLLQPIVLSGKAYARMNFDEIVLVEPSWDYVIVEGSKDKGNTWLPLEDRYDSRIHDEWFNLYNSNIDANSNSLAKGTPNLFKNHEIDILKNGFFNPGDTVAIRFRLWSDSEARGWGWAIDNLKIQTADNMYTPVEDFFSKEEDFKIYPNPSREKIKVELSLGQPLENIQFEVLDIYGKQLYKQEYTKIDQLNESFDISNFPQGIYYIKLNLNKYTLNRKLMIVK